MALALRISAASSVTYNWHSLGLGSIVPRHSCVNVQWTRGRGLRCSSVDPEESANTVDVRSNVVDTDGAAEKVGGVNNVGRAHSSSWLNSETTQDVYAGWLPVDKDVGADKLAGLLKIAAGIALAVAFSFVTYTAFSKRGIKYDLVHSAAQLLQKTKKSLGSLGSNADKSDDANKNLSSEGAGTPSPIESKDTVHGENPEPDVPSLSDLQQKKAAPGQDSLSSKDVTEFSDEENVFSPESLTDSDLESSEDYNASDSEVVDNNAPSTDQDQMQPNKDGLNHTSDVNEDYNETADDKFIVFPSASVNIASDLAAPSADASKFHKLARESISKINVFDLGKEQSDESFVENAGSTEPLKGLHESEPVAKLEAKPSTESGEETTLTVSASLLVNKAIAKDVLQCLDMDIAPFKVDATDLTAPQPNHLNETTSVIETLSSSLGSEFWHSESVESFGKPAPSAPSAAAQATSFRVFPSIVDQEQEQALKALQALKVIEPGVEAGGICTRREYARWLIAITGALARSPGQKVFPAMYIDAVSELAFNDVVPEDPDFPYIQGLAEAGLISSNISRHDTDENGRSIDGAIFLPDSPLSRQDLITWKVALEGRSLGIVDMKKLKAQTRYIDLDRIHEDVLPFLAIDLAAGERSTISTVFGYTRRLQPGKPVTRAQAAMALITGDAADIVAEELTRLEADDIAEAAVVAELALESRAQKQVDEYFNTELKLEKDLRLSAQKQVEDMNGELERVMKEMDDERVSLRSVQAAVQAERDLLHRFRQDLEKQLCTLTAQQVEIVIDKSRVETLLKEAEDGGQAITALKTEVEIEKKALILARLWAEDEAKNAREHAKMHEEARKRWEGQGIEVRVDNELQDDNIPALGWKYGGPESSLNKFLQRTPVQEILEKAGSLKSKIVMRFVQILEAIGRAFAALGHKIADSFQSVRGKASDSVQIVGERASKSLQLAGEKAHTLQHDTVSVASRKAKEVQDATMSTVSAVSLNLTEGTRKIAEGFRGEAQKFAGKFKS